jgi:hypothetical protein
MAQRGYAAGTRPSSTAASIGAWQYVVDALIENVEISLGRRPVKIGADGVLTYVFRPEAVNTAIKMAASEVGLFKDKAEVTHRMDFSDLSDDALLLKLRDETDALIRERAARAARENGDLAPKIPKSFSSAFTTRAETLSLENKQPEARESGGDELAPRWRSGRAGTK